MCGIAGFIDKKKLDWKQKIKAMCDRMAERGPDGYGCWVEEESGVTLGHRRLSILDLSENGGQPMVSASGKSVISFNGEIYNFRELKECLEKKGERIQYRGNSDTEVLVEAFDRLGLTETLDIIRGMFAVALFNRSAKKLYLVRDRMGEKPLYYGYYQDTFLFASNLDAICAFMGRPDIDRQALLQFICYGYIPGALSIYRGFHKVLPGEYIVVDVTSGIIESKRQYWSITEKALGSDSNASEEELTEELKGLLQSAIREQMVADVPVGAYLSGGVDSSLIVSIMQELAGKQVRTYTIGIEGQESDEAPWAQKVADVLGVNHTVEYISKENMLDGMLKMGKTFSEPFADVSQIPTYMVSRLAKRDVTVTLSGDAGDELFCGYAHYYKYPEIWNHVKNSRKYNRLTYGAARVWGLLPRNRWTERAFDFRKKCESESLEDLYRNICEAMSYGDDIVKRARLGKMKYDDVPLQKYRNSGLNDLDNLMLVDCLQYLPDDILVKVDSTGMAVSLENRIPLLDKRIIEFAWRVPTRYKYDGISTKKLMRNVLYQYVPKRYIERPKQGFAFPALKWLIQTKETREWIDNLFDERISGRDILDKKTVMYLWNEYKRKRQGGHVIWNMVMLLIWAEERNIVL